MTSSTPVQQRIGKLDSVRGIAALMVLIGHCGGLAFFGLSQAPHLWWVSMFWDAEGAVMTFFILSGFVLALQLGRPGTLTYTGFLTRRFWRIWPAFALTLVLAFLAYHWTGTQVDAGAHIGPPSMPGARSLVENLLMIGDPYAVNPPVWTLYVEARLSLIFPLLLVLAQRLGIFRAVLLGVVLSAVLSRPMHWHMPEALVSLAAAAKFIVFFVLGAALAQPENSVAVFYRGLSRSAKSAWFCVTLILLAYKVFPARHPLPVPGYVNWVGVSMLFVFCLYSNTVAGLLNRKPLLFLGKVSYGLYLAHYPIMLIVKSHVPGPWANPLILVASILTGWAIHHGVELPFTALGRRLTPIAKTLPA